MEKSESVDSSARPGADYHIIIIIIIIRIIMTIMIIMIIMIIIFMGCATARLLVTVVQSIQMRAQNIIESDIVTSNVKGHG